MFNSIVVQAAQIPVIRPSSGGLRLFDSFWDVVSIALFAVMALCALVLIFGIGKWVVGTMSNNPHAGTGGMKAMLIALGGLILAGSFNAIIIFGMGLGVGA